MRKTNHLHLMLKHFFPIILYALISTAFTGSLVQNTSAETIVTRNDNGKRLKELFISLKHSKSEAVASDIANSIREEWTASGSASIDLMLRWADEAISRKDYSAAMDFLDQVITLKPDFAEGWNRRATLHFIMNNYSKSMLDIEKTLELEPRHFGALAGMGMIFLALNKKEQALSAYQKALEVYPLMRDVQKTVGEIEDQIAGSRI
jgi:tetratricopeptide (TPR) repeat protein